MAAPSPIISDWNTFFRQLRGAVNALAVTAKGSVLAATPAGLFILLHGSKVWHPASDGLLDMDVRSVAIHDTMCYVGTSHDGMFRASMAAVEQARVAQANQQTDFELEQNVPNPFGETTRIGYDLSKPGSVTITLTDALGRECYRSIVGQQSAGHHNLDLDGHALHVGIYHYTMEMNGQRGTRMMLVVR